MPLTFFKKDRPLSVAAYAGFRNENRLWARARILRRDEPDWSDGKATENLLDLLRLYASHEVPGVKVSLEGFGTSAVATSDEEGFVTFDLPIDTRPLPNHAEWQHVTLCLPEIDPIETENAPILSPGIDGRLGIISDIDDTIIESGAHEFFANWRRFLLEMPSDRVAVSGAPEFFERLGRPAGIRPEADLNRAFFYVSSSPWNLYGFLAEFKRLNNLPRGPMLLRDWGMNSRTLGSASHGAHKRQTIERILDFYPDHRFVLIGDDTQGDAEAYWSTARDHPDRIAAVFLRMAAGKPIASQKANALAQLRGQGIPVWTGPVFDAGHAMLEKLGFDSDGETAKLVAATESS
ncbi:MAG: App1 family protein [Pseudomonadota bacterium]